jgi:hypothetical protein
LVSVLTDSPWTDRPASVHPALAAVADAINGELSLEGRRLLVPVAPWLCGTSTGHRGVATAILRECANVTLPHVGPRLERRLLIALDRAPEPVCDSAARRRQLLPAWRRGHELRVAMSTLEMSVAAYAAALPAGPTRDLRLVGLLESCLNRVRQALSTSAVEPRLELHDCPDHIYVEPHWAPHPTTGERTLFNRPADRLWVSRLVAASVPEGGQIRLDAPCLECCPRAVRRHPRWLGTGLRLPGPRPGPGQAR